MWTKGLKETPQEIKEKNVFIEEKIEKIFKTEDDFIKNDIEDLPSLQTSLEEEFKDAISADVATQLFEKATKENPVIDEDIPAKNRSLNDALFKNNLQIQ